MAILAQMSSSLLIKPARRISDLKIDVDKSFGRPLGTHTPAWVLPSYFYRKKFTVNGTVAGAQTNYQVPLTLHFGFGVDAGNDVYLNKKVGGDFTDIRFANSTGAPLDFWLESYTEGIQAKVWVELDSIPIAPGTADFWLYYGGPLDFPVSNGPATFIIFNSGNTVAGWTDVTIAGGGNIDWAVNAGKIRGTSSAITAAAFFFSDAVTGINSYRMHAHIIAQDGLVATNYRQGFVNKVAQNNVLSYSAWRDQENYWRIYDEAAAFTDSGVDAAFDARVDREYILIRTPAQLQLFVDTVLKVTHLCGAWSPQTIGLYVNMAAAAHWADFWNIFVANYADPEPTIGAWDPEQIYRTIYGLFTVKELALAMAKGDVLFFNGTQLAQSSPGSIGTEFTAHGPGADPTWEYPP